jgi:P-type Cu2+ transporter
MIQNLAWAAGYNIVAIPLAAGAFEWAGVSLSPAIAAILMSLSTIVVALNAQLLRRLQLQRNPIAIAKSGPAVHISVGLGRVGEEAVEADGSA